MAFKMKGFPKIGNPKDFARQQKLKADIASIKKRIKNL